MKRTMWGVTIFIACFAAIITAASLPHVLSGDRDSMKIGIGDNVGTEINLLELHNLSLTASTSAITSSTVTGTYYVSLAWKSADADPGKVTASITAQNLTVTTANSVTGVCSVAVYQAP